MPRVKQKAFRSFKELCLESISSNIDRIWCREFLENYHGKAHYLFFLGRWTLNRGFCKQFEIKNDFNMDILQVPLMTCLQA